MAFQAFQERLRQLFRRAKFDGGAVSKSTPVVEVVQTWNNPNETFVGKTTNITNTQSAAGSLIERWQVNNNTLMSLTRQAKLTLDNGSNLGGSLTVDLGGGGTYQTWLIGSSGLSLKGSNTVVHIGYGATGTVAFDRSTNVNFTVNGTIYDDALGHINITARSQLATATTNLKGRSVYIAGGNGASSSSGEAHGGDVVLAGGTGYGTGTKGIVTASRLRADGFATATAAKTASYTATLDDGTIEVDASGAARTITLFAASGNAGKIIIVKKTDSSANAVTVDANASETIDGAATISLASQYSTVILQVNAAGTGWHKLGGV